MASVMFRHTTVALAALVLGLASSSCIGARLAEFEGALTAGLAQLDERVDQVHAEHEAAVADLDRRLDSGEIDAEQYAEEAQALKELLEDQTRLAIAQAKADAKAAADAAAAGVKEDLAAAKEEWKGGAVTVGNAAGGLTGLGRLGDLGLLIASFFGGRKTAQGKPAKPPAPPT